MRGVGGVAGEAICVSRKGISLELTNEVEYKTHTSSDEVLPFTYVPRFCRRDGPDCVLLPTRVWGHPQ